MVGSLQSRNYEDKHGNKRTAFEVVCDEAHFVESKADKEKKIAPEFKAPPDAGFEEVDVEDGLPF